MELNGWIEDLLEYSELLLLVRREKGEKQNRESVIEHLPNRQHLVIRDCDHPEYNPAVHEFPIVGEGKVATERLQRYSLSL